MKKRTPFFAALYLITIAANSQQTPSAAAIFEKMKEAIGSIKTLSYESEYQNFNSGLDDSLSIHKGTTWLTVVPADTIFGAHFHTAYEGKKSKSDYYYDGTNAIDIYHRHEVKDLEKTITVLEPLLLGNGYNRVQSRVSVLPYLNELVNVKALAKWLNRDSITVKEAADKKHWILEWNENSVADNFYAKRQVYVDKETYLVTQMHRPSTWNGTRMGMDLYIKNIRVNKPEDLDFVSLKQSYPDYKTKYDGNKKSTKPKEVLTLTGQKASPFSYASFTGENLSLKPAKGKFILLDFWETWCGYCYLAMPRLKDLHQKYKDQGLEIIGIVTENKKGVQQVIDAQKFPYPTMYADEALLKKYKVEGRPTYFLIDDTGTIVEHSIGSLDEIEKAIIKRMSK